MDDQIRTPDILGELVFSDGKDYFDIVYYPVNSVTCSHFSQMPSNSVVQCIGGRLV